MLCPVTLTVSATTETSQKMDRRSSGSSPLLSSRRKSLRMNFLKPQSLPCTKRYARCDSISSLIVRTQRDTHGLGLLSLRIQNGELELGSDLALVALHEQQIQTEVVATFLVQSLTPLRLKGEGTLGLMRRHQRSLSLTPAQKVDDLRTSPISSRQKEKLLMVHLWGNGCGREPTCS